MSVVKSCMLCFWLHCFLVDLAIVDLVIGAAYEHWGTQLCIPSSEAVFLGHVWVWVSWTTPCQFCGPQDSFLTLTFMCRFSLSGSQPKMWSGIPTSKTGPLVLLIRPVRLLKPYASSRPLSHFCKGRIRLGDSSQPCYSFVLFLSPGPTVQFLTVLFFHAPYMQN